METPPPDRVLDTSGKYCPVPIIEAAKAVKELGPGRVLCVISTDPGIQADLPAWCKATKHELLGISREGKAFHGWVRTKAKVDG